MRYKVRSTGLTVMTYLAVCDGGCEWRDEAILDERTMAQVRAAARWHTETTGHTTVVEKVVSTYYRAEEDASS